MQSSTNAHRSSAASRNLASALDSSSALTKNGFDIALYGILISLEYWTSNEGGSEAAWSKGEEERSVGCVIWFYFYLCKQCYISSRYDSAKESSVLG